MYHKLNMDTLDPAVPCLGIYLKQIFSQVDDNIETKMFVKASFIIKTCPMMKDILNKLWYIYIMGGSRIS